MQLNFRSCFTFFVSIILVGCQYTEKNTHNHPPTIPPKLTIEESAFVELYNMQVEKLLASSGLPGAGVSVVHNNTTLIAEGYGVRNTSSRKSVNENTVFRIGSLSKGVAATVSSILVQEGLLSWDEKVKDIIPEFELQDSIQTERITIKHLLSHSTGLPYHSYTNLVEAGLSIEKILPEFKEVNLLGQEGILCAYQNAAFSLIEMIIEKKCSKPLEVVYKEKLFDKNRMCSASCSYKGIKNTNHASPHRFDKSLNSFLPKKISKKYYNSIPSGGVNASASDMAEYLKLLLGNKPEILTPENISPLFEAHVATPGSRYFDRWADASSHYGLGWRILEYKGRKLAYHGGFVNNFRSEIAIDYENNIAVCLLFNANIPSARTAVPTFFDLWDECAKTK